MASPEVKVKDRKWTQYIAVAADCIEHDEAIAAHAATQVRERTEHFYRTMPPQAFLEVNRKEWVELHTRLNDGVPVPPAQQLAYPFPNAPSWCDPQHKVLGR